uniref:Pentacotripeptide-repeat region of PRORP domain-containing protein n=1 Tax=Leersia perrieri TaxID=77586 RepID=A0A0D9VM58_9ORYZ
MEGVLRKTRRRLEGRAKRQASALLLRSYIAERNVEKAETFMAELLSGGALCPYSCNQMLKLYIATYQYGKVLTLIDLMKRDSIGRNPMSYNIWMNACAEVFGLASVQSVFEEMLNDDKVKVDWRTYCMLANIFRKYGQNSKTLDFLRTAETKLPSTRSLGYPFIMTCYAALNDRDGVMRLWKATESVQRRIPTANYMTAMIKVGDIVPADWIYGRWEAECRTHDVRVSSLLIAAYVRSGLIEEAERLHLYMLEKGARPDHKTWEILMEGFVQSKQMDKAINAMEKGLSLLKNCHWRPPVELWRDSSLLGRRSSRRQ